MIFFRLPYKWFIKPLVDRLVFPLIHKIWDAIAAVVLSLGAWWRDMPKAAAVDSEVGLEDRVSSARQWTGYVQWQLLALAGAWFFGGKALPAILMAAFVVTLRLTAAVGASLPRKRFMAIWKKKFSNPLALGTLVLVGLLAPAATALLHAPLDRWAGLASWTAWVIAAHWVASDCASLHREDRALTARYAVQLGKAFGVTAKEFDDRAVLQMVDHSLVIYPAPAGATSASTRAEVEPALANWLPDFELDGERSSATQLVLKPLTMEGGERRQLLQATKGLIQRFEELPAKEKV